MTQEVNLLPSKYKTLSSNPSIAKTRKKTDFNYKLGILRVMGAVAQIIYTHVSKCKAIK
jgi:hypothetical protein